MTFHDTGGPAPAYRLAPDTPAEIAADLACLCAAPVVVMTPTTASPAGQCVLAMGSGVSAEPACCHDSNDTPRGYDDHGGGTQPTSASPSRRLALFGAAAARVGEADAELAGLADEIVRTLDGVAAPWRPNAETLAAIADAEAGRVVEVTLDELRAMILADDEVDGGRP